MTKPVIAWSHSRVNSFLTCPRKLYEESIAKNYPFQESEASRWGLKVHKALELRLSMGAELPANMSQYESRAASFENLANSMGFEIHTELELAVNQSLEPCGWKDWNNCWARCALDLALIHPTDTAAVAVDWKTGKKKSDDKQLALQAAMIFRHYPHVQKVKSMFVWLKEAGEMEPLTFNREQEPRLWKQYLPIVRDMTDAATFGKWPAKPSGLCKQYCPVDSCRHNGNYQGDKS